MNHTLILKLVLIVVSFFISDRIIQLILNYLKNRYLKDILGQEGWMNHIKYLPITIILGNLERIIYVLAFLENRNEFIAVWLALKAVGTWKELRLPTIDGERIRFNIFMIGNGLSILFSYFIYQIIKISFNF